MIELSGFSLLLLSIIAYKLGRLIITKVSVLDRYHIPAPVIGGLACSALLSMAEAFLDVKVQWHFELRNVFLLIFFCTVGLNAHLRMLISGGKILPTIFGVMVVFLILQNTAGILTAIAIGDQPIHGLLAGSISMAGGHGTAISWGTFLEGQGYQGATEFGLMAATMGLISGGLLGGPIARRLISKHNLKVYPSDSHQHCQFENTESHQVSLCMQQALNVILMISFCIIIGLWVNQFCRAAGFIMPDYLPVLLLATILVNIGDLFQLQLNEHFINLFGDICLEMFITMSLMSLNLLQLVQVALPALIIVAVQALIICLFSLTIMFRAAGKNYDASLITAGFIGLGLGATPVGLANVHTLTERFGPSPKAFLIVPLMGSVFVDAINAVVLQGFLSLPVFNQ